MTASVPATGRVVACAPVTSVDSVAATGAGLLAAILEAMAALLPVLSTWVGGIPELVRDGVEGLLAMPGDRATLAVAMEALATDEACRARMGAAGLARVREGYCNAVILPRLFELYDELRLGTRQVSP